MREHFWHHLILVLFMAAIFSFWLMVKGQCEDFGGTLVRGFGTWERIIPRR